MKMPGKCKAGIVLIAGFSLSGLWVWFFSGPAYPLWRKSDGHLPENIYFPIEEFLALNSHPNSPYVYVTGAVIAVGAMLLALKLNGRLQKWYEYVLLLLAVFVLAALLLPCLCRPAEYGRRARCLGTLRRTYHALELYAGENDNAFPEAADVSEIRHPVHYYGKGKHLTDKPFVILEDACRIHAGDMRHRLWSNGGFDVVYPWREKETK